MILMKTSFNKSEADIIWHHEKNIHFVQKKQVSLKQIPIDSLIINYGIAHFLREKNY